MPSLTVNGKIREFDAEPDTPLLWVLREQLGPHRHQIRLRRRAVRRLHRAHRRRADALLRASRVLGRRRRQKVVTIEGLSPDRSHPLQKAWVALDVPQCGLLPVRDVHGRGGAAEAKPRPSDADIDGGDDQHLPLRHLQPRPRRHQAGRAEAPSQASPWSSRD